jgi:beta-phosphoglucomutase-like phosphatase (HAD superfamily)
MTIVKAVLFDLDGTLVDSRPIEALRKARRWKDCVSNLRKTSAFDGVTATITKLRQGGIRVGIITTSVSFYAKAMCGHHGFKYDTLVCYHDASPKPAPDPFLLALTRFDLQASEAIGIGDDSPDSVALAAAKIRAFGAGWSPILNPEAEWEKVLSSPNAIMGLLS